MSSIKLLAYEQAHLIGKGGGAATASRRSWQEEWGEPLTRITKHKRTAFTPQQFSKFSAPTIAFLAF